MTDRPMISRLARTGSKVSLAGLALAAGLAAFGPRQGPALAQGTGWSEPVLIFEADEGQIRVPALVADEYGQVHAFWGYQLGDVQGTSYIYYTRLDQPDAQPVDILTAPGRGIIAAQGAGGLAVFWNGANYSLAGPSPDVSAKAWSHPDEIQRAYDTAGLATAPDGALWVIYGSQEANAVFVQRMDPERQTWESPALVANVSNSNSAPNALRLAVGPDGSLHAVWAEYKLPDGWPPLGLYYAQSVDGGLTWSLPRPFDGLNYNQPSVITGPNDRVFLAWVGAAGVGGKYFQESPDGGRSWEPVVDILPPATTGGSEGPPNLALDGVGGLHMVFSNAGCVWHVSREGETWSAPECVSTQPVQIEEPAMAIGLGNQIHVLYWTQRQQLWYTARTLPIPAEEPALIPTEPPPTPTVVVPTATAVPTATPLPDLGPMPEAGQAAEAGLWALAAGVAPVALLVVAILAQRGRRRR
jgi:hypothetical protein